MKIALISTYNEPRLGYTIQALLQKKIKIDCIILDNKQLNEEELNTWSDRTGEYLPYISLSTFEVYKIPIFFVANINSSTTIELLKHEKLDFLINAGIPRIIKGDVLSVSRHGIINTHPGILPYYRGLSCVEWAILNDEPIGNTVHIMDDGIDTGPILAVKNYTFLKNDTYTQIRSTVFLNGLKLLANTLKALSSEISLIKKAVRQGPGDYYHLMDEKMLEQVKEKVNHGLYKFQINS